MRFRLSCTTDNAAFEDDRGAEIARILRKVADACERGGYSPSDDPYNLHDVNGNKVGAVTWTSR